METIQQWQDWYRAHRPIAELDAPGVSKDSRENLHDTTNVTSVMSESNVQATWHMLADDSIYKHRATEHFSDTLAEYANELSGQELFDCFVEAIKEQLDYQTKEIEKTKELLNLVQGRPCQKTCETK